MSRKGSETELFLISKVGGTPQSRNVRRLPGARLPLFAVQSLAFAA